MIFRILFLLLGVFACSTAVIFIKASHEHAVLLSAYRLLVAVLVLVPVFLRDYRKHRDTIHLRDFTLTIVPGIILGLHFVSWIIGARMTTATNASLIVNLVPVAMPFFLFFLIREHLTRKEIAGTVLALVGMLVLSAADYRISREFFRGDLLCFLSMLFFSGYLALGRKNRHFPSIWLYVIPLYLTAGLFCLLVAIFLTPLVKPYPPREIALILALGIIPTVIGHSILNHSLKHLRGQLVSIINMAQFVFAGIMAFFLFREIPDWTFYVACLLLLLGSILAVTGAPSSSPGR